MTEGHAAHGIARRLRALTDQPVRSLSPSGRFDAAVFDEAVFADAEAVGKHLLVRFDGFDEVVHAHLAMRGRWSIRRHRRALDGVYPRTMPPVKGNVAWRMLSATHHAELTDPWVCETLDAAGLAALRARLGPDPLRDDADPFEAVGRMQASVRPIGQLLTDQSVIAGVGNVYRAELLFRARLDPFTPGNRLSTECLFALWWDTAMLMDVGLQAGWIVSGDAQLAAARAALARGERVPRWRKAYAVYGRAGKPCRSCGNSVRATRLGLQRIFWCPTCQRPRAQIAVTSPS